MTGSSFNPEYPLDGLTPKIKALALYIHQSTRAPMSMCAISVLASSTLAVQGLIKVQWRENVPAIPVGIFFVVEAVTGERKSANDMIALGEHYKFNKAQFERNKENALVYEREQKVWAVKEKGLLSAIRRKIKDGVDSEKEEEALKILYANRPSLIRQPEMLLEDVTPQAIIRHLAETYPYAGLFSGEAGITLDSGALGNPGIINSLWDSGTGGADRISRGSIKVHDASLTVYIQVQPDVLATFLKGRGKLTHASGNSSRWLYVYPESTMGERAGHFADPSLKDLEAYNARIRDLLSQYETPELPIRKSLTLADGAQRLLEWFSDTVEKELRQDGRFALMKGVAAKAAENCVRLAAVMHEFEGYASSEIGLQVMKGAIMLVAWHLNQFRMRFSPRSQKEIDIDDVEELITRHRHKWAAERRVSSTDFGPLAPSRFRKDAKALRSVMDLLEVNGKVTIRDKPQGGWVAELDHWFPITYLNGRPRAHPTSFPNPGRDLNGGTHHPQHQFATTKSEPPNQGYTLWPGMVFPGIG